MIAGSLDGGPWSTLDSDDADQRFSVNRGEHILIDVPLVRRRLSRQAGMDGVGHAKWSAR